VILDSLWIVGPSRCGKTTRLVEQFCIWVQGTNHSQDLFYTNNSQGNSSRFIPRRVFLHPHDPGVLVFAANSDNQRDLADKIITATQGKYPVRVKTPLGFFQDEIILYFPLLVELLNLKAQFPVRLRPETEQELATKLWKNHLTEEILKRAGVNEYRLVRRILDLLQLAALSGTSCGEIGNVLASALQQESSSHLEPEFFGELLWEWRNWCLQRGFLSYGIITELYSQHLLPNPSYQKRLVQRYQAILADDVGDYPAIARNLFEILLDKGACAAFSYNPDGIVRLGLGADPIYLAGLAAKCEVEMLTPPLNSLADFLATPMVELVNEPMPLLSLPSTVQSIQTMSRASLLRQTAEIIIKAVKERQVQPKDIVIIAPGLDAIARYSLVEILSKQNIPLHSLNDQRPLIASPIVRALLTLIALIYPGLGRLVDRDTVAEMLVVLSRGNEGERERVTNEPPEQTNNPQFSTSNSYPHIDPVRAGLIADYCFVPHPEHPNLLPETAFDRWDRLGFAATTAYKDILQWMETERSRLEQRFIPSPISLLYAAIEKFFLNGIILPYDQLAVLREFLETAQHYWEIDTRLGNEGMGNSYFSSPNPHSTIAEFIQLLRRGTVSANPYPVRQVGPAANAVTLATIFQYRSSRKSHKWHFWLDISSPLWSKGGAATLFGANIFLRDRMGQPWTAEDETLAEHQRVKRILADLLARVSERLYLCHSELAVNGQEQLGPLLPLVHACISVVNEPMA
jgi:hypothetical protein